MKPIAILVLNVTALALVCAAQALMLLVRPRPSPPMVVHESPLDEDVDAWPVVGVRDVQ